MVELVTTMCVSVITQMKAMRVLTSLDYKILLLSTVNKYNVD